MLIAIKDYAKGNILDVGGGEFYKTFLRMNIPFERYTICEQKDIDIAKDYTKIILKKGNAEKMEFQNGSFDTVLCIQMLEHTLKPLDVINEISRVLKKGGVSIFLVPQTSLPHDIPEHYYNFTTYFLNRVIEGAGLKIIRKEMLGGLFLTLASHLFHTPLYIFNNHFYRDKNITRGVLFFLFLPLKLILLPVLFIATILLSIGDIKEAANNILVIAIKE